MKRLNLEMNRRCFFLKYINAIASFAMLIVLSACLGEVTFVGPQSSTSGNFTLTGKASLSSGKAELFKDSRCTDKLASVSIGAGQRWTASVSLPNIGKYPIYGTDHDPKFPSCDLVATAYTVSPTASFTRARGGSNLFWYRAEGCTPQNLESDFWQYSIVRHYHEPGIRASIQAALGQMYASGQRRLRTGLYHARNGGGGATDLDSTGGKLSAQHATNLRNFLADIKAAKFEQIIFGYFPMGINDPKTYSLSEEIFQENWNFIVNTRKILVESGLNYLIDLGNEMTPWNQDMIDYTKKLWANYTYVYGKNDTLGFSIVPSQTVYDNMTKVYNGNYPNVWSLHFYGTAKSEDTAYAEIKRLYVEANGALNKLGINNRDWIVGETFYNSPETARAIKDASLETGKIPRFVLQWPLTPSPCKNANVSMPGDFIHYINQGF